MSKPLSVALALLAAGVLPAGRYLLRVKAVDRAATATVTRDVNFEIR